MSITQTDAPCWHLIHTDGPTRGEPFERDLVGAPHYSTKEEAQEAADGEDTALKAQQVADEPCCTVKCAECDYVLDEDDGAVRHHPTRGDAVQAALGSAWSQLGNGRVCSDCSLICPACNGA